MSVVQVAWSMYLRKLQAKPVQTKALTAAGIQTCSDVLAQRISGSKQLNLRRTGLMALFGLLWAGPSLHYWQQFLEKSFRGRKQSLRLVIEKACLDQSIYGPAANLTMMAFITLCIEKKPLEYLKDKVKKQFVSVQLNAWKIWPVASLVNYSFVPPSLRVLFMNCVGFMWSTFLIYTSQGKGSSGSAIRKKKEQKD